MGLQVSRSGNNLPAGLFVPQIYSAKMQEKFYAASVVPAIANHDWEGEIKNFGDKVLIRKIPTVVISDYTVNSTLNFQDVSDEQITLLINKAKSYAVKVDYIDEYQADINIISKLSDDAAMQTQVVIDKDVLQTVYSDSSIPANNTITASNLSKDGASSTTAILDQLMLAGQRLDELNIPRDGRRWVVLSPKGGRLLKTSPLSQAYITGDPTSPLRNGFIGNIDGMKVYVSNNVLNAGLGTAGGTTIQEEWLVGHECAISFASQFVRHEQIPLQNTFGWGLKGLNVYGFAVTKGDGLIRMRASYASGV